MSSYFVDDALTTNIMSQNHLKIEHPEIGSRCHGYQNVRKYKVLFARSDTQWSVLNCMPIHHLWTVPVNLGRSIDNLRLLEPISRHKTRVTKTVNLYSYLRLCGNIMRTAGANENLWLTKATGIDTNGCHIPNDSNFALFWAVGDVVGSHGGKMKNWRFCNYLW